MARINLLPWREERRKQRQQEFYVLLGASAVAAILAVFLIPCSYRKVQASTPDVIYFHALGG